MEIAYIEVYVICKLNRRMKMIMISLKMQLFKFWIDNLKVHLILLNGYWTQVVYRGMGLTKKLEIIETKSVKETNMVHKFRYKRYVTYLEWVLLFIESLMNRNIIIQILIFLLLLIVSTILGIMNLVMNFTIITLLLLPLN